MDSLKRIASRQFNDLTQKRQSTQLKSCSDDFASSFDEPVHPNEQRMELAANPRPIKKLTNTLKNTFRRIENRDQCKRNEDDESTPKNKTTVLQRIQNAKESASQLPGDIVKFYKQAKIIDVRNGKLARRTKAGDHQNLLLFEELDNSTQH